MLTEVPTIDKDFEAGRAELKRQAQEWAGLEQNPNAELFVFVGRWSLQKGVDLIADIFPWVLEQYPQTQLIVSLRPRPNRQIPFFHAFITDDSLVHRPHD